MGESSGEVERIGIASGRMEKTMNIPLGCIETGDCMVVPPCLQDGKTMPFVTIRTVKAKSYEAPNGDAYAVDCAGNTYTITEVDGDPIFTLRPICEFQGRQLLRLEEKTYWQDGQNRLCRSSDCPLEPCTSALNCHTEKNFAKFRFFSCFGPIHRVYYSSG